MITMDGEVGAQEIVATSKFKSSKPTSASRQRQREVDIVDDWDAESSGEDNSAEPKNDDVFKTSKDQWTEA